MQPFTCLLCQGNTNMDYYKENTENKLTWFKLCKKHIEEIRQKYLNKGAKRER